MIWVGGTEANGGASIGPVEDNGSVFNFFTVSLVDGAEAFLLFTASFSVALVFFSSDAEGSVFFFILKNLVELPMRIMMEQFLQAGLM